MAIDNTDSFSGPYLTNGVTTVFPFSFTALTASDVEVMLRAADGTESAASGFVVSIDPAGGGSVTFAAAPAAGSELFVMLEPEFTQPIAFENGSAWLAEPVNEVADRGAQRDIWLRERVGRAVSVPFGEEAQVLPPAAQRANKFQGYDALGRPISMPGTGADEGLREALADPDIGGLLLATPDGRTGKDVFNLLFQADVTLAQFTAAAQAREWAVGNAVFVPLWGGSRWTVRAEVILQNHFGGDPLQSSKVDFDDELHVQVPLAGGGTGVLECDDGSIQGFVSKEVTRLYNEQFARFARKISLETVASINCFGDSITYGQTNPALVGGDQVDTGFGDGSKHAWTQIAGPWPAALLAHCSNVFGADKVAIVNRGYSGDRVGSAYKRHRFAAGSTISFIAYGTNDTLFGSNNGVNPERLFDEDNYPDFLFAKFTPALRKFVYREVLKGSLPILCSPYVFNSLAGYDGTPQAAGKIAASFRMAIKAVADEIGAGFLDWSEIVNGRDLASMTHDGIHPSETGHNTIAAQTVAMLIGGGWRYATRLKGRTLINGLPHFSNVNAPAASGASDFPLIANSNTLGKPFTTAADGADAVLDGQYYYFAFYSEIDEIALLPVGFLTNTGTLTIAADFGAAQGKAILNTRRGAALGDLITLDATDSYTNATGVSVIINHPASAPISPIVFQGRGWHVFSVRAQTSAFVMSGIAADPDWAKIGAAVADAAAATYAAPSGGVTQDAEARAAIAQLAADNASIRTAINTLLSRQRDRADILQ